MKSGKSLMCEPWNADEVAAQERLRTAGLKYNPVSPRAVEREELVGRRHGFEFKTDWP